MVEPRGLSPEAVCPNPPPSMKERYKMGCFETFIESKRSICPECGALCESDWQSKDGPCDMMEFKQGEHMSLGRFCGGNTMMDPKWLHEYTDVKSWVGCTFCTGNPHHFLEADIVVEDGVFVGVKNIRKYR